MTPDLLRSGSAALFLDVDGTLLDFAPSPTEVIVPRRLLDDIANIQRNLDGALALVSGRTIADLDDLFHPLRLRASGVHGAEMRYEPLALVSSVESASPLSTSLWIALIETLSDFPGTLAENKRYSFAIHYRSAPRLGPTLRTRLMEFVEQQNDGLAIIEAHFAFEIKSGHFDKGSAIERLLSRPPFSGRVPIFVGDDWTDESGFAAVDRRGGTAFSVGSARPHVSGVFSSPAEVREWLGQAAQETAIS